jgi:hypothetical protein
VVKKLKGALQPTATITGTPKPKISTGSKRNADAAHADENTDNKSNKNFSRNQRQW